jgi:hypothetical protein
MVTAAGIASRTVADVPLPPRSRRAYAMGMVDLVLFVEALEGEADCWAQRNGSQPMRPDPSLRSG